MNKLLIQSDNAPARPRQQHQQPAAPRLIDVHPQPKAAPTMPLVAPPSPQAEEHFEAQADASQFARFTFLTKEQVNKTCLKDWYRRAKRPLLLDDIPSTTGRKGMTWNVPDTIQLYKYFGWYLAPQRPKPTHHQVGSVLEAFGVKFSKPFKTHQVCEKVTGWKPNSLFRDLFNSSVIRKFLKLL
ncbi:uncharacterized protein [Littorina saxatilis]|uniref:uncharacterized protein n=1 Tax=Littorina saxatilis TaxID=31220 RepID=UPI0038B48D60